MKLTEREQERLMVTLAADVAGRRRARGLRLNQPEAVAVITSFVLEGARDGRTVADLMADGREVLTSDDVLPGVPDTIESVQVEATFPDGTKLVTVHDPIPNAGDVVADRGVGICSASATAATRILGLDPYAVQGVQFRAATGECAAGAEHQRVVRRGRREQPPHAAPELARRPAGGR